MATKYNLNPEEFTTEVPNVYTLVRPGCFAIWQSFFFVFLFRDLRDLRLPRRGCCSNEAFFLLDCPLIPLQITLSHILEFNFR